MIVLLVFEVKVELQMTVYAVGGVDGNNHCVDGNISGDGATIDNTKGLMIS